MTSTKSHDIGVGNQCPNCHEKVNEVTSVSNKESAHRKPVVGDFSVCSECGTTLRFIYGLF